MSVDGLPDLYPLPAPCKPPVKPLLPMRTDWRSPAAMEPQGLTLATIIIWSGATISVLGLFGLVWCIIRVSRAKRAGLDDDAMRKVLQSTLPLNLGALFLSVIGLMMVIVGVFLS